MNILWFLGPLLYLLFNYELSEYPLEYSVLILGVLVNVYWTRYSPWSNDTDRTMLAVKDKTWENEKKITDIYVVNNPRQRIEFYGTQFVLCSMLFLILVRRYDMYN